MTVWEHLRATILSRLQGLTLQYETLLPYVLALLVGLAAGGGAIIFRHLISAFDWVFFNRLSDAFSPLGDQRVILLPVLGGLLVGPIIYFLAREAKGHGVPEVMLAVETQGGRIRPRVAVIKSIASALCIGSGGSVGREGPIVQIGSAVGSTLGQLLRLSEENIRLLVASGAAGGISATFNAPIAGVFFALEVILRRFNLRNFSVVVLSSVVADALAHAFLGDDPAFAIPPHALESNLEFPLYALLGLFAALAGLAFITVLYKTEDIFDALRLPEMVKPAIGGIGMGLLGLWFVDLFGVGYGSGPSTNAMPSALTGDRGLEVLIALAGLKILATSLTIGSGGSGGVFAPSLFIGAMLGAAYGDVAHNLFPDVTASSGAYALVGMAAVFAAAARAPITSILILFEMTRDYSMMLPLMMAVAVATVVAQLIRRDTIYTLKLRRRGVEIEEGREAPLLQTITVGQAMARNFDVVSADTGVAELLEGISAEGQPRPFPVLDRDRKLVGILTPSDIERVLDKDLSALTVQDIAAKNPVTIFPDQTLEEAVRRLGSQGLRQLPVVSRHDPSVLLGLLRHSDVINASGRALATHARPAQPAPTPAQVELYGTEEMEFKVVSRSPLAGKRIRDIDLPTDSIIVSIVRDGSPIIPRGDVSLEPGDRVVLIALPSAIPELWERFGYHRRRRRRR
jgi:CIC family chloride channel protein